MLFRRFPCEPLAQSCYVLADGDEALIVDPMRDAGDVLAFCAERGLRVSRVIATHVHADFVAGLVEVRAATGAEICLGERFSGALPCRRLPPDSELPVGDRHVRVIETPGHTPDSICLFVEPIDDAGAPLLLTGDTLFVGDVGRPDLLSDLGLEPSAMAAELFDSLHRHLAGLPDETEVWPAHGQGSLCGASIAGGTCSTLGVERRDNWAFLEHDADRFATQLLRALATPPRHFARIAALNREGPPLLATLATPPRVDVRGAQRCLANGAVLLDVRGAAAHGRGHWPGAIAVGVDDGEFETLAGSLVPDGDVLVHATDAAMAERAWRRLRRVGHDDVAGVVLELPAEPERLSQIDAIDLFAPDGRAPWQIADVRRQSEFAAGHVPGAVHWELRHDMDRHVPAALDRRRPTALLCEGGYRSRAAAHVLRRCGFGALANVADGMPGWRRNHLPMATGSG